MFQSDARVDNVRCVLLGSHTLKQLLVVQNILYLQGIAEKQQNKSMWLRSTQTDCLAGTKQATF